MKQLRILSIGILVCVGLLAAADGVLAKKPVTPAANSAASTQTTLTPAVKDLIARAQKGEAKAQYELGNLYYKGQGVKKNDTVAYAWFTKAAVQNYEPAIMNTAYFLRHGIGVEADSLKARNLYVNLIARGNDTIVGKLNKAAKEDIFLARTFAYAYESGKGVKHNPSAVKTYLKQAIDLGDKSALYPYAMLCLRTRDHVSAQKAFKAAFKNGDENAGFWYGRYLINGEGGMKEPAEGFRLVYPWAERERIGAMLLVAECLRDGNGTTANLPEAMKWFEKASAKGNAEAQWNLALCLAGTDDNRDYLRAFSLMNRSAMHSSENRFREWVNPDKGDAFKDYSAYMLFLQGLTAIHDSLPDKALKISKDLKKLKLDKEAKIMEGLTLVSLKNPKRNVKKGFKLLAPYLESDPMLLFAVDNLQLSGALEGLDKNSMRKISADLERLGQNGIAEAYSLLGDLYLDGKEGLQASDQRALANWTKAEELDGLSYATAQVLARCYEEGLGGLKQDPEKAKKIRQKYVADQLDTIFSLIPLP